MLIKLDENDLKVVVCDYINSRESKVGFLYQITLKDVGIYFDSTIDAIYATVDIKESQKWV